MTLPPALRRFSRYASIGVLALSFDLAFLYFLTSILGVAYYVSTPIAFLIATSGNYVFNRLHTFRGTTRSWHGGYAYFISMALSGAAITTAGVVALVSYASLPYFVARVLVAGVVGFGNYLFNLYVNFKVVGIHE